MRRDIEPHGAIGVIDATGQIQSAAADLRRHIFKKQARGIEDKIALDAAQSSWEIDCTRLRVVDMYFSCDARTIQCAFEHRVNLRGAARLESGTNPLRQPRSSPPLRLKVKLRLPVKRTLPP